MKRTLLALAIICLISCKKKQREDIGSGIIKSYVGTLSVTLAGNVHQGKSFVWDAREFDRDGKVLKHSYSFEDNWLAAGPTGIWTDEVAFTYRNGILSSARSKLYAATRIYTVSSGDPLIIDNLTDNKPNYTNETRKHQNGKIVQSTLKRFAGTRVSDFYYDSRGFLVQVKGVSGYAPQEFTIDYERDGQGRLLKETEISKWGEIVRRAFKYAHDGQGRLVSFTYFGLERGWSRHEYTYNGFGHKKKVIASVSATENGTYIPYGEINYSYVYW